MASLLLWQSGQSERRSSARILHRQPAVNKEREMPLGTWTIRGYLVPKLRFRYKDKNHSWQSSGGAFQSDGNALNQDDLQVDLPRTTSCRRTTFSASAAGLRPDTLAETDWFQ